MSKTKITFISSRGRGMDPELKIIKDSIVTSDIQPQFRYFIKQERTKNVAYADGLKSAKKDLAKGSDHIICMDMSLNVPIKDMPENGKKILLQIPFNYMHEAAFDKQNKPNMANKVGSKEFTHIYSHSPFGTELLKTTYDIDGVEIIEGYCSPVSYQLADEKIAKDNRELLTYYYPESEGKKIFGIYMRGKLSKKIEWFLENLDPEGFLASLPEDWFFLTDTQEVMELFRRTDITKARNFGYLPQIVQTQAAISFTDILITNQGHFLSYQAARRKPCYTMEYSNTNVDKYMERNYPQLHVKTVDQFMNLIEHAKEYAEIHQKANEFFSYPTTKDVREHLLQLLK